MKLAPDMHHLNSFNIPKNKGVNEWLGGGAKKLTPENAMKLRELTLTSSKTSLENTKEMGIFTLLSITICL